MLNILAFIVAVTNIVLAADSISSDQLHELQKRFNSYYDNSSTISVKGITIGGWLVTEPYITPSLYNNASSIAADMGNYTDIVDEYTLCDVLGYDQARSLLEEHFETWINEDDFKQISEDGFNLVRLPIGYWAWKQDNSSGLYVSNVTYNDPFVSDGLQLDYLEKALSWAEKYQLNVWIDLHAAPPTQNGFDNSGQRILYGELSWLSSTESRRLTLAVWNAIFDSYLNQGESSPIVGIEIMNEPLSSRLDSEMMMQFYYEAFSLFKNEQTSDDNTTFVIHDAFMDIGYWNLEFNPNYRNISNQYFNISNITFDPQSVMVDHHHYEVFTDSQLAESQYQRIENIINFGDSIYDELTYHPAVVGEWSAAITDCATWLNGVGIGARYDGSYYKTTNFTTSDTPVGNCTSQLPIGNWTKQYREQVRQFVEAQLVTYSTKTSGWIFWNWKTEGAAEWDYLKLKDNDLFPSPFNNYTYFQTNGSMKPSLSKSLSKEATATSSTKKNAGISIYEPFKMRDQGFVEWIWKISIFSSVLLCVFTISFI